MINNKLIIASLGALTSTQLLLAQESDKLNVIVLMVDDMNGYGVIDEYPSVIAPNLKRLRKEGINFVANSCACPVSVPSRTSFYSGLYPHNSGAYYNASKAWIVNEDMADPTKVESIPECFKNNGYTTWGSGKIFHSQLGDGRMETSFDNKTYSGGFGPFPDKDTNPWGTLHMSITEWDDNEDDIHPDNHTTVNAIKFLSEEHDKPFMMCIGLWRPHTPYNAPKRFFDLYDKDDLPFPEGYRDDDLDDVPFIGRELIDSLNNFQRFKRNGDLEESLDKWKQFIRGYCANYSFADWNIGRILDALEQSEYSDNTIVVFCSDNGFHCGEKYHWQKGTLWEQAAYVPLIIRLPDSMRNEYNYSSTEEIECHTPVGLIDIYPTLVDLCDLQVPPQQLDGESLRSIIDYPLESKDRKVLTTYGIKYSSVRNNQYRLLTYPDGTQELYDLINDPHEFKNIINDPQYKALIADLETMIPTQWAKDVGGNMPKIEIERQKNAVQE